MNEELKKRPNLNLLNQAQILFEDCHGTKILIKHKIKEGRGHEPSTQAVRLVIFLQRHWEVWWKNVEPTFPLCRNCYGGFENKWVYNMTSFELKIIIWHHFALKNIIWRCFVLKIIIWRHFIWRYLALNIVQHLTHVD